VSLDYYAFLKSKMDRSINNISELKSKLTKETKKQIKDETVNLAKIEPHLAYLWYGALDNDIKDFVRESWQKSLSIANNPWREGHYDFCQLPADFRFVPDTSVLDWLPPSSFMLQVPFKLQKPYLSKDERDFYLMDNPLRREKIFKTPMVAAASWKGALRAAMVQQLVHWWESLEPVGKEARANRKGFVARRCQLARLFGTELGIREENNKQYLDKLGANCMDKWFRRYVKAFMSPDYSFVGRLYFYPTLFQEVGLEVINPHHRATGIPRRGPIPMECVPAAAKGYLTILYVPFGPAGKDEEKNRELTAYDLQALAEGVKGMLGLYGFGAKTSSGFGTAQERLAGEGRLVLRVSPSAGEVKRASLQQEKQHPDLPRYLEAPDQLIEELRRPDGTLKPEEEYRQWVENSGSKYKKGKQQLYAKAKAWWEREGFCGRRVSRHQKRYPEKM
jgi:CRISPR-associated protein Cmr2